MTFNEIKDMINSTIVENGQRQITGKSINLALIETLTAIEEYLANYKPDVDGLETVYGPDNQSTLELTPEHQAANAAVYAKCAAAVNEGRTLPGIQMDVTATMSSNVGVTLEKALVLMPSSITLFILPDSPSVDSLNGMSGLVVRGVEYSFSIAEDGTLSNLS